MSNKPLRKSIALSFLIYLVPIPVRHAGWLPSGFLVATALLFGQDHLRGMLIVLAGFAITQTLSAGFYFYWLRRGRKVWNVVLPISIAATYISMSVLPKIAQPLIVKPLPPPIATVEIPLCVLIGDFVRSSQISLPPQMEVASEYWVLNGSELGILKAGECLIQKLPDFCPAPSKKSYPKFTRVGARALVSCDRKDSSPGDTKYFLINGQSLTAVEKPKWYYTTLATPLLFSDDNLWVLWKSARTAGELFGIDKSDPERYDGYVLKNIQTGEELNLLANQPETMGYQAYDLNLERRELRFRVRGKIFLTMGFDGHVVAKVEPNPSDWNYRSYTSMVNEGASQNADWISSDYEREISWQINGKAGRLELSYPNEIKEVRLDSTRKFFAIRTNLSIFVFRVADAKEIFRLNEELTANIDFPWPGYFIYSHISPGKSLTAATIDESYQTVILPLPRE